MTDLLSICQKIGPDLTASHVLPQLRDLFDELAFSQETTYVLGSVSRPGEDFTGSRAGLLYVSHIICCKYDVKVILSSAVEVM